MKIIHTTKVRFVTKKETIKAKIKRNKKTEDIFTMHAHVHSQAFLLKPLLQKNNNVPSLWRCSELVFINEKKKSLTLKDFNKFCTTSELKQRKRRNNKD